MTSGRHRVTPAQLRAIYAAGQTLYAWPVSNVVKLDPPVPYRHPGGGSWVRLTGENRLQARRAG